MPLPKFLHSVLWSYDISEMSPKEDCDLIITQVLNHGDRKQLEWLANTYSRKEIEDVVRKPRRGVWFKRVLDYWLKIFGLKIPQETYQKAVLDINPKL